MLIQAIQENAFLSSKPNLRSRSNLSNTKKKILRRFLKELFNSYEMEYPFEEALSDHGSKNVDLYDVYSLLNIVSDQLSKHDNCLLRHTSSDTLAASYYLRKITKNLEDYFAHDENAKNWIQEKKEEIEKRKDAERTKYEKNQQKKIKKEEKERLDIEKREKLVNELISLQKIKASLQDLLANIKSEFEQSENIKKSVALQYQRQYQTIRESVNVNEHKEDESLIKEHLLINKLEIDVNTELRRILLTAQARKNTFHEEEVINAKIKMKEEKHTKQDLTFVTDLSAHDWNHINNDLHLKMQFEQIEKVLPMQYSVVSKYGSLTMTCEEGTGMYTHYEVEIFYCPQYKENTFVVKLHNDPKTGTGHTTRFYFTYNDEILTLRNIGHWDAKRGQFVFGKNH
jgi:hypothetical protein